jgi:adsorption protein B
LNEGHAREAPLGRVLMAKGWLDEETLAEAIAFQSDLERGSLDPERLPRDAERLPLADIVRHRVLPQGEDRQGRTILLTANPISEAPLAYLVTQLGQPVTQRIVREGDIATGIRLLRGVDVSGPAPIAMQTVPGLRVRTWPVDAEAVPVPRRGVPLIGDLLIELGHVTRASFEGALQSYRPDLHGLIGDYMVAREVISRAALENVIQEQHRLRGDEATR